MPTIPPDGSTDIFDWWTATKTNMSASLRKGLNFLIILTSWAIWKHRNAVLFDNITPSYDKLLNNIKREAKLWARAGTKGLDMIILVT